MNNYEKEAAKFKKSSNQKMKEYAHHLIQENAELRAENEELKEENEELSTYKEGGENHQSNSEAFTEGLDEGRSQNEAGVQLTSENEHLRKENDFMKEANLELIKLADQLKAEIDKYEKTEKKIKKLKADNEKKDAALNHLARKIICQNCPKLKAENEKLKAENLLFNCGLAEYANAKFKEELEENEREIYNLRNENERMEQIYRDAEENNKQLVELSNKQKILFGRF